MWLGAASAPGQTGAPAVSPRSAQRVFRLGERGYPEWDPRGSPFQMPTRLADGLGLESDLGHACARPFAPPPDSRFFTRIRGILGPPRRPPGREASLGCSNDQRIAYSGQMSSDHGPQPSWAQQCGISGRERFSVGVDIRQCRCRGKSEALGFRTLLRPRQARSRY
jgi:hypothetical protein